MNKERQRIVIAESCVKTLSCCRCHEQAQVFKYGAPFCSDSCAEKCGDFQLADGQLSIPDYCHDLNAINLAIQQVIIRGKNIIQYRSNEDLFQQELDKLSEREQVPTWHFTAELYAEALLRAIEKWEEDSDLNTNSAHSFTEGATCIAIDPTAPSLKVPNILSRDRDIGAITRERAVKMEKYAVLAGNR